MVRHERDVLALVRPLAEGGLLERVVGIEPCQFPELPVQRELDALVTRLVQILVSERDGVVADLVLHVDEVEREPQLEILHGAHLRAHFNALARLLLQVRQEAVEGKGVVGRLLVQGGEAVDRGVLGPELRRLPEKVRERALPGGPLVNFLGVEDIDTRREVCFAAVYIGPLRPRTEGQDEVLQDAEFVASIQPHRLPLELRLVGPDCLRAVREGVLVELVLIEVNPGGELVVEAEEFLVEDIARGGAHRVDVDLRERGEGGVVGGHLPPAVDQVGVQTAEGAQDGLDEKVGVEKGRARIVVGVLGLLSVGVILGLREGARELIVGLVGCDPQGDVEGVGGVVADAAACAFRGELRAVPVSAAREDLAAERIINLVRRAPDAGAAVVGIVASADEGRIPFRLSLAALGDDVDGAGDGRIAVENAVGAPHDLDPLDLRERDLQPVDPREIGSVQAPAVEHDHVAKVARLGAEGPHVHDGLGGITAVAGDVDAHKPRQNLGNARGARFLDVVGGNDGHISWNFPDFLGIAGGRDDHLAHPVLGPGGLRRRLRKSRLRCRQQRYKQNDQDPFTAQKTLHGNSSSPLGK